MMMKKILKLISCRIDQCLRITRKRKKEKQVTQGRVKEKRRISKFQIKRNRADNHKVKNQGRRRQKD
jgi:hypothetical protein